MDVKIFPARLDGVIEAVSNKSYEHRLIVASLLADKETKLKMRTLYPDVKSSLNVIKILGGMVTSVEDGVIIRPSTPERRWPNNDFSVVSSATAKFFTPVISALGCGGLFVSEEDKKIGIEQESLLQLKGVGTRMNVRAVQIIGQLQAGEYRVDRLNGSQFISGLMMALPLLKEDSKLICNQAFKNKVYVKITIDVMNRFGVRLLDVEDGFIVKGNQRYISPGEVTVEGDFNAMAYILGSNVFGNRVRVTGLNYQSLQTEKAIRELLLKYNAKGTTLDLGGDGTLAYILCIVSSFSTSQTVIKNLPSGKFKKSMTDFMDVLEKIGITAEYKDDTITIEGKGGIKGGAIVESFDNPDIALAVAVAGTCAQEPITLLSAEAVDKVYLNFFNDVKILGGNCQTV